MSGRALVFSIFATIVFTLSFTTPLLGRQETNHVQNAGAAPNQKTDSPAGLTSEKEKKSYALGMNMGQQVKSRSMDVDVDLIIRGLKDSLSESSTLLSEEQATVEVEELRHEVKQKVIAQRREKMQKNKREGEAFLAANKTREGVVTLPSGLQYKILKAGDGNKPSGNDIVFCNYRGSTLEGREFDSSYRRGKPSPFKFARVMEGWKQALRLMPVGSKWQIWVPSDLAYGIRGAGNVIEPNSTLVFELELLSIRSRVTNPEETHTGMALDSEAGVVQQQAAEPSVVNPTLPLEDIRISFKLDPRLSGSTYGGERWIASSPFTSVAQVGTQATVEAKVEAVAQNGAPVRAAVEWTPADPEMITVASGENSQVKITVHHAGESKLTVASNGVSKQLLVKAKSVGNATQVEISQ